eukprot:17338-Amphidinium_carterae.1
MAKVHGPENPADLMKFLDADTMSGKSESSELAVLEPLGGMSPKGREKLRSAAREESSSDKAVLEPVGGGQ